MFAKIKQFPMAPLEYKLKIILLHTVFVILIISGILFSLFAWKSSVAETENEAIQLAEASEAGMSTSSVAAVIDQMDDTSAEYNELKSNLSHIAALDNSVKFAYIYIQRNGQFYFLVDSVPASSPDYSPMGQLYSEATPIDFLPFQENKTILTKPMNDRWGRWVSVLVPIFDDATGEVIAVFGMDFPAATWYDQAINHTIEASVIVLCAIIIFIGLLSALKRNRELREEKQKLQDTGEKLKESELLFRAVFDQANVGIAIVRDYQFTLPSDINRQSINPMFEKILGRTKEELTVMSWVELTHPSDLAADMELFNRFKAKEIDGYEMEKRFVRSDGSIVWVRLIVSPLQLNDTADTYHLCMIEDISKRKELERAIRESEQSKAVLLDNLPGMMYRCRYDQDWTMLYVSQGCQELTGYSPDRLLHNRDLSFNALIAPGYQVYLWEKWQKVVRDHTKLQEEYEIVTASGETKWVWEQGQALYDEQGNVAVLEGLILDITDRKNNEIRLKYLSEHDPLTGLYNLRLFDEVMKKSGDSKKMKCAVVMLNVRRFSVINSTYGYRFGEKLIKSIADCLLPLAAENTRLFHISIDRFVFCVQGYKEKLDLIALCEKIIYALDTGIAQKTIRFNIGVIEIDQYPNNDADIVLKHVSIAADHVSDTERFGYRFFNKELEDKQQRQNAIRQALAAAAYEENDPSLFVLYQPILNLRTNRITGFEALARYKNESLGVVSPMEFIPIAESTQLILPLGIKIMRHVFGFTALLSQCGFCDITISFNVSPIQLLSEMFLPNLENLIRETGVNPMNLDIEITESVFSDDYLEINKKLDRIRELGIKIAIDDFGTGYSSLSRERELSVDYIKIDKYFIDKLLYINQEKAITGDIISMAHKLGHHVIAEGVESEMQKQYLIGHDCDLMQGYLIGIPTDQKTAIDLLKKG